MNKKKQIKAIMFALAAAVFYAVNTPVSKILLQNVAPTYMAAFLYLGAGTGVGIMYLFRFRKERPEERLSRKDTPYVIGMTVLDIAAPIFLMFGIDLGTASNASLLGNFEIVATTLLALLMFGEAVSGRLWTGILFITVSSIILTYGGAGSFHFSLGSLLVLLAASCWGLENNCTRRISEKSTYEIVLIKGLFSGSGSLLVAVLLGEKFPAAGNIARVMLLGYAACGLSIFMYIRAQRDLGAAKTSAYYAVTPFIGALLSFMINGETLTRTYAVALILMLIGSAFVVRDTLRAEDTAGQG